MSSYRFGVIASSRGGGTPSGSIDQAYSYTGADQDYTVASGITQIDFFLGGGGGGGSATSYGTFNYAGAGGFTTGRLAVSPGNVLRLKVGNKGGTGSTGSPGTGGWPDGGDGKHPSGDVYAGGGGGSTSLWLSTDSGTTWTLVAVAGGGGAAAYSGGNHAGPGGGIIGDRADSFNSGYGGTYSTIGYDFGDKADTAKQGAFMGKTNPAISKTGGDGGDGAASDDGGGGGGGFYGGGGGGGDGGTGAGGSGYINKALVTNGFTVGRLAGSQAVPAQMSAHAKYPGSDASKGGAKGASVGVDGVAGWAHLSSEEADPSAELHRYWRIRLRSNNSLANRGTTYAFSAANVEMRDTPGGADLATTDTSWTADSELSATYAVEKLKDGNLTTFWVSANSGADTHWVKYDFGVGVTKEIVEILWVRREDNFGANESPVGIECQYSDDNSTWTTYWAAAASADEVDNQNINTRIIFAKDSPGDVTATFIDHSIETTDGVTTTSLNLGTNTGTKYYLVGVAGQFDSAPSLTSLAGVSINNLGAHDDGVENIAIGLVTLTGGVSGAQNLIISIPSGTGYRYTAFVYELDIDVDSVSISVFPSFNTESAVSVPVEVDDQVIAIGLYQLGGTDPTGSGITGLTTTDLTPTHTESNFFSALSSKKCTADETLSVAVDSNTLNTTRIMMSALRLRTTR